MNDQLQLFDSRSPNIYKHLNTNPNPSCLDKQIRDIITDNKIYTVLNAKCNGFNLKSRFMLVIYNYVLLDKTKLIQMFLIHRSGLCRDNETIFVAHCTDTYNKTYVYVNWTEPKRLTGRDTLMFEGYRPLVYAVRHANYQGYLIRFVKSRDDQYKLRLPKQNDYSGLVVLSRAGQIKSTPLREEHSQERNDVVAGTYHTNDENKSELRNDEVKDEFNANNCIVGLNAIQASTPPSKPHQAHVMNNKRGDAVSPTIKISADTVLKLKQLCDLITPTWSIGTIALLLEFDIPSAELTYLFGKALQYFDPEEGFITDSDQDITTQDIFMLCFLRRVMDDVTTSLVNLKTDDVITITLLVDEEIRNERAGVFTLLSSYLTLIYDALYVLTEKFPRVSVCGINCC